MGTTMGINRSTNGVIAVPELVERKVIVSVEAGAKVYVPVSVGYKKYDFRTISGTNSEGQSSVYSVYDKSANGDIVYRSLQESVTFDTVNVPCEDKEGAGTVHLFIENKGTKLSEYMVIIKITELR